MENSDLLDRLEREAGYRVDRAAWTRPKLGGREAARQRRRIPGKGEYSAVMVNGKRVCAICAVPEEFQKLERDHDHVTGKARSLLCHRCNAALGAFGDDSSLLQRALDYLRGEIFDS